MLGFIKKKCFLFICSIAIIFIFFTSNRGISKVDAAQEILFDKITLSDIMSHTSDLSQKVPNKQGIYGIWSWAGIKSINQNDITIDGNGSPFLKIWGLTDDNNAKLISRIVWTFNISSSTGQGFYCYGSNTKIFSNIKNGSNTITLTSSDFTRSKDGDFIFHVDGSGSSCTISSLSIELYYTPGATATIKGGDGVAEAFLSTSDSATYGSDSGTVFPNDTTVYGYACVYEGYNVPSDWVYVGYSEDYLRVYRVGSRVITNSTSVDFGTLNLTPKTKTMILDSNGGTGSGTIDLTYDTSAVIDSSSFTREAYTFKGWNTQANGSGGSYSSNLSTWSVNELVLSSSTTLYAQWEIDLNGVKTLIDNLPEVEYNLTVKGKIKEARDGYNSLSNQDKELVDNYQKLLDAEAAYQALLELNAEAMVEDKYYESLADALMNINSNQNIVLQKDVDLSDEHISIANSLTVDLNGHVLKTNKSDTSPAVSVTRDNVVVTIVNTKHDTGGLDGLIYVNSDVNSSLVRAGECRFTDLPETIINAGVLIPIGYEVVKINADGSPDANGFISILKPQEVFDISTLQGGTYIVPKGQTLTGALNNNVEIIVPNNGTVYLDGVRIVDTDPGQSLYPGLTFMGNGNLYFTGDNTIGGFGEGQGLYIPEGYSVNVDGDGILKFVDNGTTPSDLDKLVLSDGISLGTLFNEHIIKPVELINLSEVTSDVIVSNGDTLTGELTKDLDITIVPGSTVIFKDVTIRNNQFSTVNVYPDAHIVLEGENIIINNASDIDNELYAINARDALEIGGKGSLNITFTGKGLSAYGIYTGGRLTISNGEIDIAAGDAKDKSIGLFVAANGLLVNGGVLITVGGTSDLCSSFGAYIYDNSAITITENIRRFVAAGNTYAIHANLVAELDGLGYTSLSDTASETAISNGNYQFNESESGEQGLKVYKRIVFVGLTLEDVIALIDKIGTVEYTSLSKENIDAARSGYDYLKPEEKELITNYQKLLDAEKMYNDVDDVVKKIDAIGVVEYTAESKGLIELARSLYEALTNDEKLILPNLTTLVAAEEAYLNLDNQDHANIVIGLINQIGEVIYNDTSYNLITEARNAYNDLTAEAKELVTNYNTLVEAEGTYKTFDDNHKARIVKDLINEIGVLAYTTEVKDSIDAARSGYDSLTDDQKNLVTNYNILLDDETNYYAVDRVVCEINDLGVLSYSDENGNKIVKARTDIDSLTEMQRELLPASSNVTLTNYEKAYSALTKIEIIGNIEYSQECENLINEARKAYDDLSEDQKKLINLEDYQTLEQKEHDYKGLKSGANVWGVLLLILALGALGAAIYFIVILLRENNGINKGNTLKTKSTLLPLIILVSYFGTGTYLAFYITLVLALLAWGCVIALYILNKKEIKISTLFKKNQDKEDLLKVFDEVKPNKELDDKKEESVIEEPLVDKEEEESSEDVEEETITDESGQIIKVRYNSSFTAKIIQATDEVKNQYNELKKNILSYNDTKSKIIWDYDTISYQKKPLLRFAIRGKTLCLYYALDFDRYSDSKYKVKNVRTKKYLDTPVLYKIKNDRRMEYAKELILDLANINDLIKGQDVNDDFYMPYEDRETLLEKGLIKRSEVKVKF